MKKIPASRTCDWSFDGLAVAVEFKAIKNVHIGVYPPDAKIRVAAPDGFDEDVLRWMIQQRLGWIKLQKRRFDLVERQSERQFVPGESHYVFGQRYRLKIEESNDGNHARLSKNYIHLALLPQTNASAAARKRFVEGWFRILLAEKARHLCDQEGIQADFSKISIRKMKTKWFGSMPSPEKAWINLELIKEHPDKLTSVLRALAA